MDWTPLAASNVRSAADESTKMHNNVSRMIEVNGGELVGLESAISCGGERWRDASKRSSTVYKAVNYRGRAKGKDRHLQSRPSTQINLASFVVQSNALN